LELRLIAHYSRDPLLMDAYRRGLDLHKLTGELLEISRADAKPVNFGLAYGLSYYALVDLFGEEMATRVWPLLRQRYRVLMQYTNSVHQAAHEMEYVRTLAGRKRRLPFINTGDHYQRGHAERQAFNAKMQGSAADLVKLAQIFLADRLPEFEQVLQVHDEVIGEFRGTRKQAEELAVCIKQIMESVGRELEVPLLCDPKVGVSWRAGK